MAHAAHAVIAAALVAAPAVGFHQLSSGESNLIGNNTSANGVPLPGMAGSEDVVYVMGPDGHCFSTDPTRTFGLPIVSKTDPLCKW